MDIVFDPCDGAFLSAATQQPNELASIDAAVEMWSRVAPVRLSRSAAADRPSIVIVFRSAPAAFRGLYDDEQGIIYVNDRVKTAHAQSVTLAHELGHAFGLWHVSGDTSSVMNTGNQAVEPTAEDAARLEDLWPRCLEPQP